MRGACRRISMATLGPGSFAIAATVPFAQLDVALPRYPHGYREQRRAIVIAHLSAHRTAMRNIALRERANLGERPSLH
jgi:hypothetical protein